MSQMNPYMTSPNADIYALLAQRAASLDEQASRGGGGVSAGSNVNFDLMSHSARLDERAQQQQFEREQLGQFLGDIRGRENMQFEANLNRQMMEDAMQMKMELYLEMQAVNMQLAQAENFDDPVLLAKKQELERKEADLNSRQNAAQALLAKRNQDFGKAWETRMGEVTKLADALTQYKDTVSGVDINSIVDEFKANPLKGGIEDQSGLGALSRGLATSIESVGEFFTGDKVYDNEIARRFGIAPGFFGGEPTLSDKNKAILASAVRVEQGSFRRLLNREKFDQLADPSYQKDADRFTSQLLTDMVLKGMSSVGTDVDLSTASPEVQKLLSELISSARSSTSPDDLAKKIAPMLESTSMAIFGAKEGASGVPKLIEAMDTILQKANAGAADRLAKMAGGKAISADTIQTAALANALSEAGRIRRVLETATNGKYMTSKQLQAAMGTLAGIKDKETGTYNLGLLPSPLSPDSLPVGAVLGQPMMTRVDDMINFLNQNREEQARISEERLKTRSTGESEMERLISSGRTAATQKQEEVIRQLLGEVQARRAARQKK